MSNLLTNNYNPRHAEYEGVSIDRWDASQWKKWKADAPKSDVKAGIEREYLRIKYAVQTANTGLSLERVKIKLKFTSYKSIGLQGTFPCKPGDGGNNGCRNKQYTISLGFTANDVGVKAAVAKARELDLLLVTKQFVWTPELLGREGEKVASTGSIKTTKSKLIGELIQDYEQEFWKTHEKNRQGMRTWESHYLRHLKKLPADLPLTNQALESALLSTRPNSSARFFLIWQLRKFCDFCQFDAQRLIDSYATSKPNPSLRQIPDDGEIVAGFEKMGTPLSPYTSKDNITFPDQWQWAYGMLATYGLRPHELFAIDLPAFIDPNNTLHLVTLKPELTGGTKTGERSCGIPPLYPDWVDLFDLMNVKLPASGGTLNNRTAKLHIRFRNLNLGFRPYDLRHAYAIRGHRLRIPIKTMADYMGHTVNEHTRTYQRWMSADTNLEIYKEVVIQKQGTTKEALRERIRELEAQILALKAENSSLRGLLGKYAPDGLSVDV